MSVSISDPCGDVIYPESDGMPMADDLTQSRVIRTLVAGFERLFRNDPNVLVGGDFFWYPVEGQPKIVAAPDVLIIVGTPKEELRSYQQWVHGGSPTLAVEVLSHANTWAEMARKREFYERYGVAEYWVFDPLGSTLEVWVHDGDRLLGIADAAAGWMSPTTGVTVRVTDGNLEVTESNGRRWLAPAEEGVRADAETERATRESERADRESDRANLEAERADAALAELARLRADLAAVRKAAD